MLKGSSKSVREDVRLIVSELVSNAVRHSGCAADDLIEVEASRRDEVLRLAVTDRGCLMALPRIRQHQSAGSGGLSLLIVDELASGWGTLRTPEGCCLVWAELAISPADQ